MFDKISNSCGNSNAAGFQAARLATFLAVVALVVFVTSPCKGSAINNDRNLSKRLFERSGHGYRQNKTFEYSVDSNILRDNAQEINQQPLFRCNSDYFVPLDQFQLDVDVSRLYARETIPRVTYSNIIYANLYLTKLMDEYRDIEQKSRDMERFNSFNDSLKINDSEPLGLMLNNLNKKYQSLYQTIHQNQKIASKRQNSGDDIMTLKMMLGKRIQLDDKEKKINNEDYKKIIAESDTDGTISNDRNLPRIQYPPLARNNTNRSGSPNGSSGELPWIAKIAYKFADFFLNHKIAWFFLLGFFLILDLFQKFKTR